MCGQCDKPPVKIAADPKMPTQKEIDEHFYLRRVKTPIFHIVGKLDATLGYEDVYLPWKKLVGTDLEDLKTLELEDFGHGIPKDTIVKYLTMVLGLGSQNT